MANKEHKAEHVLGYVADRSQQPPDQWWYDADGGLPLLWKQRTQRGKRWRCRVDGKVYRSAKKGYDTSTLGPYRFAESLTGHVIILGGETDTETAQVYASGAGYQFCCMPFSETTAKGVLSPLDNATQITILYDADTAGRKGAKSLAEKIMLHRQMSALTEIPVSYYAGKGNSGADLKDCAQAVVESQRVAVVKQWLHDGIQQSARCPAPPLPDPSETDGNYPVGASHKDVSDWVLREMGGQWDGMWDDLQIHYVFGAGRIDEGRWVSFQAGRWREVDFRRIMSEFFNFACKEIDQDVRMLNNRLSDGFFGTDLDKDAVKRIEAKVKHLQSIHKFLGHQYNCSSSEQKVQSLVGRESRLFDAKDLVAGAAPALGDATDCVIAQKRNVGVRHPAMVFEARTGRVRPCTADDAITRGLGVVLPDDIQVPSNVTAKGLSSVNTPAEEWVMTYCPNIWTFLCEISSYYPDPENLENFAVDLEVAALLVETAGLCLIGTSQPFFTILVNDRGRNGKGIFAGIVHNIAGELGHKEKELLEYQQVSGHTERVARTAGKHVVHVDEPNPRVDVQRLKQLTGEGEIVASLKRGAQFSFRPTCHILITTNNALYLGNPDASIRMRMTTIPCEARFGSGYGDMYPMRNPSEMYAEFESEYSHFALLSLTLAQRALMSRERFRSARAEKASLRMLMEGNPVSQWLDERVNVDPLYEETLKDLHEDYKQWSKDLGRKPKAHQPFVSDLKKVVDAQSLNVNVGYRPRISNGERVYKAKGVRLTTKKGDNFMGM